MIAAKRGKKVSEVLGRRGREQTAEAEA
jgi:hypothetical protein